MCHPFVSSVVCVCVLFTPFVVSGDMRRRRRRMHPPPKLARGEHSRPLSSLGSIRHLEGFGPFEDIPPNDNNALECIFGQPVSVN